MYILFLLAIAWYQIIFSVRGIINADVLPIDELVEPRLLNLRITRIIHGAVKRSRLLLSSCSTFAGFSNEFN